VRIAQALVNLLNNAAKFTEAGGEIWLSAERAAAERPADEAGHPIADELVFRVRDSGIGIAPHLLPHVFEMFTQGHRTPERLRNGLGVGLTLVRSLVHLHGGRIEAHSDGPN